MTSWSSSSSSSVVVLSLPILVILLFLLHHQQVSSFSLKTTEYASRNAAWRTANKVVKISVPLETVRPQPTTAGAKFWSLWNDKRSFVDLIRDETNYKDDDSAKDEIPYCVVSDEFIVEGSKFQVLLYPRGVYSSTDQPLRGTPASAYLSYLPDKYGDEVDICWKLRLVNGNINEALPIETSGGLPKSTTTWSAAMTFCSPQEAVDSVGRTSDWGSSIWNSQQVCNCLNNIHAEIEISVMDKRYQQSSFAFPPKGALGASQIAATTPPAKDRIFRAGEIIVTNVPGTNFQQKQQLEQLGVFDGIDYRVMTMTNDKGEEIFTTKSLESKEERRKAKLALRPVGWKLQQQMWKRRGIQDWPIEVEAGQISDVALSRFNVGATIPRFVSYFQQDLKAFVIALSFALAPIPLALVGRELISFYAIPSASMDPTLAKGDVLVVEKFPGIFDRVNRGDIVLFRPPSALTDIVRSTGGKISPNQLFVKRLVGLPGDENVLMNDDSQDVTIAGNLVVGPARNLCDDEPLRLIDKLLADGKGKNVDKLGEDETYVLGDCKAVSVDSRVFGTLPKKNISGRPVARVWPLNRITIGSP